MKVGKQKTPPYISFKNSPLVNWYGIFLQTSLVFCKRKSHAHTLPAFMTFKDTLCSGFWLNLQSTVLHVVINKTELVYAIYPVVLYHFHLAGSCLQRHYSHISSERVSIFPSQIIIVLEQDSTPSPKITAFMEGKGLALSTEHHAPVGDHWVCPTSLLCLWGASHPYNPRDDHYMQVLSLPK